MTCGGACLRQSRIRLLDEGAIDAVLPRRGDRLFEPRGVGAGDRRLQLLRGLRLLHGDDLAPGQHVEHALGAKVDLHPLGLVSAV